jgi:hypothetical protein
MAVSDAELAAGQACADVWVHLRVNVRVDAQHHLHFLANLVTAHDTEHTPNSTTSQESSSRDMLSTDSNADDMLLKRGAAAANYLKNCLGQNNRLGPMQDMAALLLLFAASAAAA